MKCFAVLILLLLTFVALNAQTKQTPAPKPPAPVQNPKPTTDEIDPDDVIRITTTLVNSPVLVIGRDGKFVPTLNRDDFQILEDGIPQEIAYFSTVDKPFTVALLIDTSRSTSLELHDIKDAALSFVEKMRPKDRALVVSISGQIKVLAEPTSDREELKQAILSCRIEGSSRIYDAISLVVGERLNRIQGRTAVILFSDGVDNDSREATYDGTLQLIEQTQALIFPVKFSTYEFMEKGNTKKRPAFEGSGFSKQDYIRADTYLNQAAALSGTGVYPAENIRDLDHAVASIVDELHNEYSVGYYPRASVEQGKQRRVEVRVRLPQLVVRARTSYALEPTGSLQRIPASRSLAGVASVNPIGASPSRREGNTEMSERDARWICKGVEAPTDFAVVKEGFVSKCPGSGRRGDETNAWFIKRPLESDVMCKGFMMWNGKEVAGAPVPTGYIVTNEETSSACSKSDDPKNSNNGWKILKPSGRTTMCKGFPIPRGFVTTGEAKVAGCPARITETNAWIIRPKD